jgi:peptidoglycan/LPS O-acetylase OafA/YrhL
MNTKPHYDLLDGLRGVAALMVLLYHLFEAIAFAAGAPEQDLYHGFMGVDFFFVLSGFVMGYAYDDRWRKMTTGQFIKRRLIRLHPMVVIGVVFGLLAFIMQGRVTWDGEKVSIATLALTTIMALFMLPVMGKGLDVRGNTEMFPLNGPHWSLFFEYLGSLLYALLLHKISTKSLRIWVAVAAVALVVNAVTLGDGTIAYGWSYEPLNMAGGALRILFAYPAGLLLAREFHARKIKPTRLPAFSLSAIALIVILSAPNFSTLFDTKSASVAYQCLCVLLFFPLIIAFAARGNVSGWMQRMVSYLGRLSYPLYAIHYPMIYLYIHWINTNCHPFGQWKYATPIGVALISIFLAIICLHLYDEPIRRRLNKKFIK